MAVFKATKNKKDTNETFKATEQKSYDSTMVYDWETRNKSSIDTLNKFSTKINGGGFMSADDLTSYRKAMDDYIESSTGLRGLSKYSDEDNKKWSDEIAEMEKGYTDLSDYFSQWKDEDAFKSAIAQQKEYEEKSNFDLNAGKKELEELEKILNDYGGTQDLYNMYTSDALTMLLHQDTIKGYEVRIAEYKSKYGSVDDLKELVSQKKAYLNQSKHIQEGITLSGVIENDDFQANSGYSTTIKENPSWWENGVGDTQYEWINNQDGFRDEYEASMADLNAKAAIGQSGIYTGTQESVYTKNGYDHMTADEVAIYNYYYAKDGKEKANEYLDSIQETLNYRKATERFEALEDNTLLELAFGVEAGLDQFTSGVANLFNTEDDYIAQTATQIASGMVREDLEDNGFKILGNSLGQIAYDTITTTANMAPSMLTSMAVGALNPTAGAVAGNALMFASSAGNAYQEALNLGYDKGSARAYSTLIGASEAGLQYLLGGISSLGGKVSGDVVTKMLSGIDNALARTALQIGGNMLSEGLEEGLQEVLTPLFKNWTLMAGEDINWSEVAYSGLLGALTAGIMESPGSISGEVQTYKTGKSLQAADISAQRLSEIGKTFSADTVAYQLAGRVNENTGAYTLGRLFNEIGAEVTEQNKADIQKSLERKGMPQKYAQQNAEAFAAVVTGMELTPMEQAAIEMNSVLSKTVQDVIINPNSTVNQRSQGYKEVLMQLAREKTGATATAAEQAQTSEANVPVEGNFTTASEVGSDGPAEASAEGVTHLKSSPNEAVSIKKIASIKDGQMTLELDDGREVSSTEVEYGSKAEALVYETVARMENMNPAVANALVKSYDPASGISAEVYARGIEEAYRYGYYNYSMQHMMTRGSFGQMLTKNQRRSVYNLGKMARTQDISKATEANKTATVAKETGVYYQDNTGNLVAYDEAGIKKDAKREVGVQAAKVLKQMGLGGRFVFFESHQNARGQWVYTDKDGNEVSAPNGMYYKDGTIYIDLNAGKGGAGLTLFTLGHELTHFIEQWSPTKYKVLADFLIQEYEKRGVSMDELVRAKQLKIAELRGKEISYDEAFYEVVADSMEKMFADGNLLQKLQKLKAQDEGLFNKIKGFVDKLAKKIRWYYNRLDPDSEEGEFVGRMHESISDIQDKFAEALVEASENFQSAMESVVEAKAEPISNDEIITDGAVVTDGMGKKHSIRSMKHDIADGQMFEDLKNYCGWTQKQVNELRKHLQELVEYMTPYRDILDMNESYGREGRRFSPYKPNSDPLYKISMDFSTLCSKRLLTQYVIENLQLRENRPMSAEEQMAIRDMLNEYRKVEKGLQVACAMCYVEAARLKSPQQIGKWLADPETQMKNYFADKNPEFAAFIKEKQADFKESRGYARNATKKDMSAKDVRELNKIRPRLRSQYQLTAEEQEIVERAKALPNSTYLTAGNLADLSETEPVIYSAYTAFVRTATRSKSLETDEPYYYGDSTRDNGNGIIVSDSFIEAVNRENGMRFSSWSDWRIQHLLDYITAVIDNSVRGAAMHGYTKFGEEVRVLGKTGMMFNMSGVAGTQTGLNEDGSLNFSPTESMDVDEAIQLRDEFPETAGLQCIGVSDEHIIALLRSDIIDYIIPYHVSGLNAALRRMADIYGWADYTGTQHAAIDKSIKFEGAVDQEHWHVEPVYSEFFVGYDTDMTGIEAMRASAEKYKKMCKDRGLTPKFNQFAKEENYWKLLIDRKMINQKTGNLIEQKPVTPTFDFGTIKEVVDRYVKNYDSGLEARALNHIVENWDSIPQRIKDLKKQGGTNAKKIKKAVDTLANQTLAAQPADDAKKSTREYAKQVDKVKNNTHDPLNHVYMGTTPTGIAKVLDLPKLPMLVTPQHIYSMAVSKTQAQQEGRFKSRFNYHDLGWDAVKKLPEYINKPVLLIKSNTDPDDATFVVVTAQADNDGNPIVAAVKPNGRGNYFNIEFPTNFMLSGYGKDGILGYVARAKTENRILYANKNSQKNKNTPSVQFADNILSSDYTANLAQFKGIVKSKFVGTAFENSGLPKFSDRDSNGNQLTKEQSAFFAHSKVRDADGNLMVMYHGTANGGLFTVFDGDKLGNETRTTQIGQGFYFTNMKKEAEAYMKNVDIYGRASLGKNPHLHEVYLNITKPFNISSDTLDSSKVKSVYMDGTYEYFFDNWIPFYLNKKMVHGKVLTKAEVQNMSKAEKVSLYVDYLSELGVKEVLSNMVRAFPYGKQSELLSSMKNRLGYDGIVEEFKPGQYQYVAFSSEQVKSVANQNPTSDPDIRYSDRVTDKKTLNFLNEQIKRGEYIITYKSMRLDGDKLHSPMAAEINGKFENDYELGNWYQAVEHPELIKFDKKNGLPYFELDKGVDEFGDELGKVPARYNPYEHSSNYVINDQFKTAFKRSNLVVVEMRIPLSEISSGYQAQYAKDPVGWQSWKKGDVATALAKKGKERKVLLSRWAMPYRILSDAEVAQQYKELLSGSGVKVPNNVVTPSLLKALEDAGVDIDYEGINRFNEQYKKKAEEREAKKNGKAKLSDRDTEGKQLSVGQMEFFKNSKVRDDSGRLIPMYHGTNTPNFTVFDPQQSDDHISLFFTSDPDVANTYTNQQDYGRDVDPYNLITENSSAEQFNAAQEKVGGGLRVVKITPEWIQEMKDNAEKSGTRLLGLANKFADLLEYNNSSGLFNYDIERIREVTDKGIEKLKTDDVNQLRKAMGAGRDHAMYASDHKGSYKEIRNLYADTYKRFEEVWNYLTVAATPDSAIGQYTYTETNSSVPFLMDRHLDFQGHIIPGTEKEMVAKAIDRMKWVNEHNLGNRYKVYLNITNPYILDAGIDYSGKMDRVTLEKGYHGDGWRVEFEDAYVDEIKYMTTPDFMDFIESAFDAKTTAKIKAQIELDNDAYVKEWGDLDPDYVTHDIQLKGVLMKYNEPGNWNALNFNGNQNARTRDVAAWAKENGYDGVIFKNMKDAGGYAFMKGRGGSTVVTAFSSEQVKSVDNLNPTEDPDIRYSDRDSDGKRLTEDQLEFFEHSKVRDAEGNLYVLFHGSRSPLFTEFDLYEGVWLTPDQRYAEVYAETWHSWRGDDKDLTGLEQSVYADPDYRLYKMYANITNPLDLGEINDEFDRGQMNRLAKLLGVPVSRIKDIAFVDGYQTVGYVYEVTKDHQFIEIAKEKGYDGFVASEKGRKTFCAFSAPNQVKLTTNEVPSGFYDIRYQDRSEDSVSNRSLLANAFEGVAQNDMERNKIREYKDKISHINAEEKKLHKLNEQIKELSFAKGPKDTKKIRELQFEARQTANRISTYDKQLLRLEASQPLQDVLTREKKMAYQRAEQKGKEALAAYREKATKTQRELLEKWQASRKKGIESREKTAMRHKIKDIVNELNQYLLKGTKDRHVPIGLQKAVAEALNAVNMDTVGAEERIAKLNDELLKAKTPEAIQEISRKIDHVREMGDRMDERLKKLKTAYDEFINSDDPLIANSHDDGMSAHMKTLIVRVGDTPLRDMTVDQLQNVYDVYKIVRATVRNANKSFKDKKNREISTRANQVMAELDGLGTKRGKRPVFMDWIEKFGWDGLKPVYAMEHIGSNGLIEAFNNVRAGEDTWAKDIVEAREFYLEKFRKYKYDSWDFEKKSSFTSTTGMNFELTLDQIMSLYAYAKRDQAADHLKYGGIVFDPKTEVVEKTKSGIKVKYNVATATSYNISEETLGDIISKLTDEQKGFVDEMQAYLSDVMGAKGNEVSLAMYDVKLFREKNYFPLKSATQYMAKAKEQAQGDVKIKNSGFSKETKPHAKNPIVLSSFMDVWANHVNDMSMYHAFVLPMEDFYRIYNYTTPSNNENLPTEGVNPAIENVFGTAATGYIEQMLKDLNGGARTDSRTGIMNKMMGLYKKGAVFASLSVVVQQPSAIARAAALVDAKYFIGPKVDHKKHKQLWDEVKQYAPVAIIKEMGYFDTNMGKSTQDFITGQEYSGINEKAKALVADSNYRDEILSKLPALADEVAWCSIWEAVKRETQAKHPGMDTKSEAFLKAAGERFTEVITKTQVYDSVLSRSALMRSKDTGLKMATSFMAEPTTSINMIADALLKGKRGDRKYCRTAIGAVIASQILNSILVSFVYAARDDDEDETYLEKYIGSLTGEVLDGLNPLTYIPFIKDIVSIVQGYDVERSDMAVISDLVSAAQKLTSDNVSVYRKVEGFAGSIAQLFGLPVKNIMRDVRGIYQTVESFLNGQQTTAAGIGYAVKGAVTGKDVSNQNQLYEAYLSGDKTQIARVESRFKDQSAINQAIRKALRENDSRIREAAEAVIAGDAPKRANIAREIAAEGHFKVQDIQAAINAEIDKIRREAKGE